MLEEKVYDTIKKYELIENGNTIVIWNDTYGLNDRRG